MDRKPIADSIADDLLVDAELTQYRMKEAAPGIHYFVYWEELSEDAKPVKAAPVEDIEVADPEIVPPDLEGLKKLYTEVIGKKPFHGWSAEQLMEKINKK